MNNLTPRTIAECKKRIHDGIVAHKMDTYFAWTMLTQIVEEGMLREIFDYKFKQMRLPSEMKIDNNK